MKWKVVTMLENPQPNQGPEIVIKDASSLRTSFSSLLPQVIKGRDKLTEIMRENFDLFCHKRDRKKEHIAFALKSLIDPIAGLDELQYRSLVGVLSHLNEIFYKYEKSRAAGAFPSGSLLSFFEKIVESRDPDISNYRDTVAELIDLDSKIFQQGFKHSDIKRGFLTFLRAAYPLGANMLVGQVGRDLNRSKQSLPTNSRIAIAIKKDYKWGTLDSNQFFKIHLIPQGDGQTTKVVALPPGQSYEEHSGFLEKGLQNGQSLLIGRRFQINKMLGMTIESDNLYQGAEEFCLTLRGGEAKNWSRAAVLVIRQDNQLYFFDRGSTWSLAIADEKSDQVYSYEAKPIVLEQSGTQQEDAPLSYGNVSVDHLSRD